MTAAALQDQSVEPDRYVLARDTKERNRLEEQHKYLTETVGGTLIVAEDVKLHPGSRALDCGTGAGSWLLALSKEVPSGVELVGVDLSPLMFPKSFPKNVKFYEASITSLPSDWTGAFDFVNQRLLLAAFTISQWQKALSEHFRVLKAGGAVQFMEYAEFGYPEDADATRFPASRTVLEIFSAINSRRDLVGLKTAYVLPELLDGAGFTSVRVKSYKAPLGNPWGENGVKGAQNAKGVLRASAHALLEDGPLDICQSVDEYHELIDRAEKEWHDNPGSFVYFYAITAKKPLSR